MNLGDKQRVDSLLARWPAPLPGGSGSELDQERRWEERADAIVKAALEKKGPPGDALDALLGSPALAPEPGEAGVLLLSGEKKMAEEKEPGASSIDEGASTRPPASTASPPTERKRTSLKEIAARASQSGARLSTPAPPSVAPSRPSPAPSLRPVEAGKEDSGVINLDVVRSSVTAQQVAAAEKARPGQAGLFDDEKAVEPAASAPEAPAATAAAGTKVVPLTAVPAKKSNAGAIAGAVIAVLGLAAAFAIVNRKQPDAPPAAPIAADVRPAGNAIPSAAPSVAPSAAPQATATAASTEPAPTPSASESPDARPAPAGPGRVGPGAVAAVPGAAAVTAPASGGNAPVDPKAADKGAPAAGTPPGDLQSEIAKAAGAPRDGDKNGPVAPIPEPAAGGARNQNIPEQPSQGSVQAAVGAVMGGAKGCVAGADDISRAQVTFSSSGQVSNVSVTGWAAAHGKSGCVQAALKGAKVGPFSKSTFTVPVSIRP